MRIDFSRLLAAGILLAAGTGAASLVAGAPFLTSAHGHPHLPFVGEIPLASAMVFDLGVFMTVLGATMLTITVLGQARARPNGAQEVS
jgi:multicomponent K+:H+ antiporter subunit A